MRQPLREGCLDVHGHLDHRMDLRVYNWSIARPASIRLLVSCAEMRTYALWLFDVAKAYLQSAPELTRVVYDRPARKTVNQAIHLLRFRIIRQIV